MQLEVTHYKDIETHCKDIEKMIDEGAVFKKYIREVDKSLMKSMKIMAQVFDINVHYIRIRVGMTNLIPGAVDLYYSESLRFSHLQHLGFCTQERQKEIILQMMMDYAAKKVRQKKPRKVYYHRKYPKGRMDKIVYEMNKEAHLYCDKHGLKTIEYKVPKKELDIPRVFWPSRSKKKQQEYQDVDIVVTDNAEHEENYESYRKELQ